MIIIESFSIPVETISVLSTIAADWLRARNSGHKGTCDHLQGKFVNQKILKSTPLYDATTGKQHARDAARHVLFYYMNTDAYKLKLAKRVLFGGA